MAFNTVQALSWLTPLVVFSLKHNPKHKIGKTMI